MATSKIQEHFYDEQIRRYLLQFIRFFSCFRVKTGRKMNDGITDQYIRVPAKYGDASRMASQLLKQGSENMTNSTPMIACTIQSLDIDRQRTQEPLFTDTHHITEREFDEETGLYTDTPGNRVSVSRMMPVPYKMTVQADIWTSNTDQKLQLLEQILVLYNPALELQHTTNFLDWTLITMIELTGIQWTTRSVPAGIDESIDIASLTFEIPIWLNPPAEVTRQQLIESFISNMYMTDGGVNAIDFNPTAMTFFSNFSNLSTLITTPKDRGLQVYEGADGIFIKPLSKGNIDRNITWEEIFNEYGKFNSGASRLRLKYHGNITDVSSDIVGTMFATTDPTLLKLEIDTDTLPENTLSSVDRVIDPSIAKPGFNGIPNPYLGQRYLCIDSATSDSAWNINIYANDIIEYNGSEWIIVFNASMIEAEEFVTNSGSLQQFKFVDGEWIDTYQGIYDAGFWKLELLEED
jgi:hypothetical protein